MAKKEFKIRSVKLLLNVEEHHDGLLHRVQEVPVMVFEDQFQKTLASLATALLGQVNGLPELNAGGEDTEDKPCL